MPKLSPGLMLMLMLVLVLMLTSPLCMVAQTTDVVRTEIKRLDEVYAERKQNMTQKMEMKIIANCRGEELLREKVTYHYGKGKVRAISANWDVIVDGDYYIYVNHFSETFVYGYQSEEGQKMLNKLNSMENLDEYLESASRSELDTLPNGLYKLSFWQRYGEFYLVTMTYNANYELKNVRMEAQKPYSQAPLTTSYCIDVQVESEVLNKTSNKDFSAATYMQDIRNPETVTATYSTYQFYNQTPSK